MATRILVVDDEPQFERLILQRFRRRVRSKEFEFVFALNGIDALKMIKSGEQIDMVLTDINMPQMDGLTLTSELREIRPQLKIVIISAYGDMPNIRKAMNLGAFDFITKPVEFSDLETTIDKTLEEVALLKDAALAQELSKKNDRLQELDQLKTQFFTNISHEFRTPLTVIFGMADQIEEKPEAWLEKGVSLIKRNAHNLLELVNQILDLSKLESGKLKMTNIQGDLIVYLRFILESFHSLAERNDIKLSFHSNLDQLWMDYDPEKLLRIVTNLIDNAIKYTKEGGEVILNVNTFDKSQVKIEIKDTGIGISKKELPYIFDRFYQVEGSFGTGIGLSLVKHLVHLMDGQIHVESEENKGTSFFMELPVKCEAERKEQISTDLSMIQKDELNTSLIRPQAAVGFELPHLLIVEDNKDVAQYLVAYLEGHYKISLAHNGQEGIDAAFEHIPDLIVSDVMMPIKDGYELCNTLKMDQRTSHIPIVLLTAKADMDSKIEGLQKGADAYLAKPFDKKELRTRLEKLLELRAVLQKRYQVNAEEVPLETSVEISVEDEFIQLIKSAVFDNLDDIDFGIPELCKAIGMSRTQLHRKTKALTGRSTSNFVRSLRLGKAKELLHTSHLNISQIAYEVGFRDPKYFSRTFAEEFGISPNQMRP